MVTPTEPTDCRINIHPRGNCKSVLSEVIALKQPRSLLTRQRYQYGSPWLRKTPFYIGASGKHLKARFAMLPC